MSTENESIVGRLEQELFQFVVSGAREILSDITRLEFEDLASRNPSFATLAGDLKKLLIKIEVLIEKKEVQFQLKVIRKVHEYAEILDSIAESVASENDQLLIDCMAHLNEFIEMNGKGEGGEHE